MKAALFLYASLTTIFFLLNLLLVLSVMLPGLSVLVGIYPHSPYPSSQLWPGV